MTKRINVSEYAKMMLGFDKIMILTHGHPDGDTLGTGVALLGALCELGKEAVLVCADTLSYNTEFIKNYADGKRCFFGDFSAEKFVPEHIVSVDVASMGLFGKELDEYTSKLELALDHHAVNTLECPFLFVEEKASSAGETMFFAIKEMEKLSGKKLINKDVACALYAAIASDSGNFKYSSTSSRTMMAAGELIDLGADNAEISRQLFDIKTFGSFKAEALCTENVSFYADGKIAFSYMNRETAKERGIEETEFDTCVQILRMIKGVEVAVFAKEKTGDDGIKKYRLSMRSNKYVDVAEIAACFDGGGHIRASGCSVEGDIDTVIEKITEKIIKKL
jgi:phosphoesterase RecJ-like protein